MENLSPKQLKILEFIEQQISLHNRAPTYREIAQHFGFKAVGTVQDHIAALIRKGFLKKQKGRACGFTLSHYEGSKQVPILGTVPAGNPIEATEHALGSISIPAFWKGGFFALKVKGDSMIEAGILEGDYVIVRQQATAENGDIVVALVDGEVTVKYFENKKGRIRLVPANVQYQPIDVHTEEGSLQNAIQGKVVSVQRFL